MVGKVGVVGRQVLELVVVEHLDLGSRPVPEGHGPLGLGVEQLVENVAAHGGHAGAAPDKAHFPSGLLDKKIPVRPAEHQAVPWLAGEEVGGGDTGRDPLGPGWRGGDPDGKSQLVFSREIGHGVGAENRLLGPGLKPPEVKLGPDLAVLLLDIDLFIGHGVLGHVDLDVGTGLEVEALRPGRGPAAALL